MSTFEIFTKLERKSEVKNFFFKKLLILIQCGYSRNRYASSSSEICAKYNYASIKRDY